MPVTTAYSMFPDFENKQTNKPQTNQNPFNEVYWMLVYPCITVQGVQSEQYVSVFIPPQVNDKFQ